VRIEVADARHPRVKRRRALAQTLEYDLTRQLQKVGALPQRCNHV
jgi:hypothetical protein